MCLNNHIFRVSFICSITKARWGYGITIITHAIFMKIRIVYTLRADWL